MFCKYNFSLYLSVCTNPAVFSVYARFREVSFFSSVHKRNSVAQLDDSAPDRGRFLACRFVVYQFFCARLLSPVFALFSRTLSVRLSSTTPKVVLEEWSVPVTMLQERVRPTLKRTKYACVNCKAAKAACDSNRPCAWCIRHALQDSCVDAPRKIRTSKKICCDPSLHAKTVVLKQEPRGDFPLSLAADFTPTTTIPPQAPLSPPSEIFAIEDLLAAPNFDFGVSSTNNVACTNCPLYTTCAKDATQRLICATSASPPQSPLSPEQDDDDGPVTTPYNLPPISLATHPEFNFQLKTPPPDIFAFSPQSSTSTQSSPQQLSQSTPQQYTPATPQHSTPYQSTSQYPTPQQSTPPQPTPQQQTPPTPQQVITNSSTTVTVQPRNLQGCCSFATSPHLPPLLDDICNCQSLVQREMAKINASLETISALMQLQNGPLIPTATFRLPNTTIEDCNDEFARALGYDGREDLLSIAAIDELTLSTQLMMKDEDSEDDEQEREEAKPEKTKPKPLLTSIVPEKWGPGLLKCAYDLQKATLPVVNQMVFTSKRGESRYYTVLIKPCGWFAYISILKQHPQIVEGLVMCGE